MDDVIAAMALDVGKLLVIDTAQSEGRIAIDSLVTQHLTIDPINQGTSIPSVVPF